MSQTNIYHSFLETPSKKQWKKIGLQRRAGVSVPLFSIYSSNSVGIGEIPDISHLVDWCKSCKMSIIQLLPLNDMGYDFQPYSAQTSFALDPMHLSLTQLQNVSVNDFMPEIESLRKSFPTGRERVDYKIKSAKMALLWKMFNSRIIREPSKFKSFLMKTKFWMRDYALFKVLKEKFNESKWEDWDEPYKMKDPSAMESLEKEYSDNILFQEWIQWQIYEQFRSSKKDAEKNNVYLMGDLPFLVSRDSADVWSNQQYFKLDSFSGAPPDLYFANGQVWGMPPFNWENIAHNQYDYLIEKINYAQNFYDMYRVDHVIGIFRLYTVPVSEPSENAGLKGGYDPADKEKWEEHGKTLLHVILDNTDMLPCGEDLGTVPPCSYKVLKEYAIPGLDVQRWSRDWDKTYDFILPEKYRKNAVAILSNHDMCIFSAWWKYIAGTIEEIVFKRKCESRGIDFELKKNELFDLNLSAHGRLHWKKEITDESVFLWVLGKPEIEAKDFLDMFKSSYDEKKRFWEYVGMPGDPEHEASAQFIEKALKKSSETRSVFCIQLIDDFMSLGNAVRKDPWDIRINFPGINSPNNWTIVCPVSLEEMKKMPINKTIKKIHTSTDRL